ncbi:lytic murein transglycosylase [Rickettsiales bacterium]|nr:lytic murein transglycosylase [Rickettsiales bacterium]
MLKIKILLFLLFFHSIVYSKANDSPDFNSPKTEDSWNKWIKKIKKDIDKLSLKSETKEHLDNITYNKRVIELDRKQPEFRMNFKEYLQKVVPESRVSLGKKKYQENKDLLLEIKKVYNINPYLILSLWGIETSFGSHTGGFDTLNSLATLAYDGRRSEFFYKEFKYSLEIIDKGYVSRKNLRGSWAGAIGQTQFMPSTFISFSQDFDMDGKTDLLNNKKDALASGANYLNKLGWDDGLEWGEKVSIVVEDNNLQTLAKEKTYKNQKYWEKFGIKLKKNYQDKELRLIIPDNELKNYYLVTKNFDVILKWNRSNYFALAVNILSDKIK